jgi:hypothetical protein
MNGEAACLKSCHLPLPRLRGSSGEAGEGVGTQNAMKPPPTHAILDLVIKSQYQKL